MTDLPPAIIRSDGAPLAGSDLTGHDSWTQTCATAAHDRTAPLALDRFAPVPCRIWCQGDPNSPNNRLCCCHSRQASHQLTSHQSGAKHLTLLP